jgi:hypothetical protein
MAILTMAGMATTETGLSGKMSATRNANRSPTMSSDITDRARELVDEANEIFSDGKARPRARVEAKIASALQRERDEAAERVRVMQPSTKHNLSSKEAWAYMEAKDDAVAAIRGPEPKGGEGEA